MELGLGWQSDRINQDVTSTVWDSIQINNILFIVPSNENSLLIVGYSSIVFLVTSLMLLISRVMDTIILESRWSGGGEFPFSEIR